MTMHMRDPGRQCVALHALLALAALLERRRGRRR